MEVIYKNIKFLCDLHGITINSLEAECGIGINTIYRWKTKSPMVESLMKVAKFFGVSLDYFVNEHDSAISFS